MSKAKPDHINQAALRRTLPLDGELGPTIARLRQIAAEAGDTLLLAEGPPHPDHRLLDDCAVALRLLVGAREAWNARPLHSARNPYRSLTDEEYQRDQELFEEYRRLSGEARSAMYGIPNIRATTAAGIYAKALCVRATRTGAAAFAMSLAEDLVSNPVLRAALWAAAPEPAQAPAANVAPLAREAAE